MSRKSVTVVGIVFNLEEIEDVLDFLLEQNIFSTYDIQQFSDKLPQGENPTNIYNELIALKAINNAPRMENIDISIASEYFLGYRIKEEAIEIPTNSKTLAYIKEAQENWNNLFKEIPLTHSIRFDQY